MTLVSIKTYQEVNVWESLSLYQRLGLAGWQLTHGHHFLSWGRSVFVPEAPNHAGLCLGCWHRDTRLSLSAPRGSGSVQGQHD